MKLFISYCLDDLNEFKIPEIAELLEKLDQIEKVYYYHRDVRTSIVDFQSETLSNSDIVILISTPKSKESLSVKEEWEAAYHSKKIIIPVFESIHDIPYLIRHDLGVEFNENDIKGVVKKIHEQVLKNLSNIIEEQTKRFVENLNTILTDLDKKPVNIQKLIRSVERGINSAKSTRQNQLITFTLQNMKAIIEESKDPNRFGAYIILKLSTIFRELNQTENAHRIIDKIYLNNRFNFEIAQGKASIFLQEGKSEEAISLYNEILKKSPQDERVLFELAGIYEELNDFLNAEKYYIDVLTVHPSNIDARTDLVKIYRKQKREDKIQPHLDYLATLEKEEEPEEEVSEEESEEEELEEEESEKEELEEEVAEEESSEKSTPQEFFAQMGKELDISPFAVSQLLLLLNQVTKSDLQWFLEVNSDKKSGSKFELILRILRGDYTYDEMLEILPVDVIDDYCIHNGLQKVRKKEQKIDLILDFLQIEMETDEESEREEEIEAKKTDEEEKLFRWFMKHLEEILSEITKDALQAIAELSHVAKSGSKAQIIENITTYGITPVRGLPNEALKVICSDLGLNYSGSKTDLIRNIKEYWKV